MHKIPERYASKINNFVIMFYTIEVSKIFMLSEYAQE